MLDVDGRWPQENGAIAIVEAGDLVDPDGRFRIERVWAVLEPRLARVPRLRQVIRTPRRGLGGPFWTDAPSFDLRDHVRVAPFPAPPDEAGLLHAVESLRRCRLERGRPLWELWFVPGLADGRIGLFLKVHHALADGLATMAMMAALLDDQGTAVVPAVARPWLPAPPPSPVALAVDNLGRRTRGIAAVVRALARPRTTIGGLRDAWPAVREVLAERPTPATSLDRLVGADRALSVVGTRLEVVQAIAHGHRGTVNDVLLAITAGGLRAILRRRGERVDDLEARVYVPVSLRTDRSGPQAGNQVAQMVVPVPLGVAAPDERLRRIARETARRKARSRSHLGTWFRRGLVTRLLLKAVIRQRVNVTTASLRGPERPLRLAGSSLVEVIPIIPLIGNVTLGVGALSYAGAFTIGIVADRTAYPDLEVFTAAVEADLRALARSVEARVAGAA